MADRPQPIRAMNAFDAEYRDGAIHPPAAVQADWNARGVQHVRLTVEIVAEQERELVDTVMRVQRIEQPIATAMLNALGKLEASGFEQRTRLHAQHK